MPRRRPPKRRSTTLVVRVLVATVVLSLGAWVVPVTGVLGLGAGCASAAGQIHVWLVVDYGILEPGRVDRVCVAISADTPNGGAVVQTYGGVSWNSAGLLCSLGGEPQGECGMQTPSGSYRYWSYWHGGSSWTYSSLGPQYATVHEGSVEGWHFVDGKGNPQDPPPAGSPANGCPPPPTSPAPTTTATPGPAATPTTKPAANGGTNGPGGATSPAVPTSSSPRAGDTAGSDPSSGATSSTSPTGPGDASVRDGSGGDGGASTEAVAGTTADGAGGPSAPDSTSGATTDGNGGLEVASPVAQPVRSTAPATLPLGTLIGIAVVVLISGGAFLRFRRRVPA